MLEAISALKGYAIDATDGRLGAVNDFLFDGRTWKVRWLVVDTGTWLVERKILLHPSAIGRTDYEERTFAVNLTKTQVRDSPGILRDLPVSRQMERQLHSYYGSDPLWSGGDGGASLDAMAPPYSPAPYFGFASPREIDYSGADPNDGDPDLRSVTEVTGYHIDASDGEIGHVENFLIESATWGICYLVVDTRNWWPGKHVLMSPYGVKEIDWSEHQIRVNVTRDKIKTSPPWDPLGLMNQPEMKRLHAHYNWPGFGS